MLLPDFFMDPRIEIKGHGEIKLEDDSIVNGEFVIRQFGTGITQGELKVADYATCMKIRGLESFTITGTEEEGSQIIAEECFIEKVSMGENNLVIFNPNKIIYDKENLETKPEEKILLKFALMNVHQTFRVTADTELGTLYLNQFKGLEEAEETIKTHNISAITSSITIEVDSDYENLEELRKKGLDTVYDFLKITSLAQTTWHSIASFVIYKKKNESEGYSRVYFEILSPKTKSPKLFGITNQAHSSQFISNAWGGHSKKIDEDYGFTLALEWYIDSWSAFVLESKYLNATTCMELLVEKFHNKNGTEFVLEEDKFSEFQEFIRESARGKLRDMGIEKPIRGIIYEKLNIALNRRGYENKIELMINFWKIKYDDLGIELKDIVRIRNEITHKGRYEDGDDLLKVYSGLITIIVRIFLAMLNYDGLYFDFVRQDWIKFEEVRTS